MLTLILVNDDIIKCFENALLLRNKNIKKTIGKKSVDERLIKNNIFIFQDT